MRFEVLKRSNLKRNIIIGVVVVAIIVACIITLTRAKYRTVASTTLIKGEVNYTLADLNIVAVYIQKEKDGTEYEQSGEIPTRGYAFNERSSYCTVGDEENSRITISYDSTTKSLSVSPMTTRGTKCYLYFDIQEMKLVDAIFEDNEVQGFSSDLSATSCSSGCGVEENGLYEEAVYEDTEYVGQTYYFRGTVENNWVSFAGFYWRIIRINEDGTVRLIYSGVASSDTVQDDNITGTGTQISITSGTTTTTTFDFYINTNTFRRNAYSVGYMYTADEQHGTTTDSAVKEVIDEWYENNLQQKYASYLADSGFCGDREAEDWVLTESTFHYAAYDRLSDGEPTFECSNSLDLYTVDNSKGNEALDYAIGLITADEAVYAGGSISTGNTGYWLYTGQSYWTMTPYGMGIYNLVGTLYFGLIFSIATDNTTSNGTTNNGRVWNSSTSAKGVRPVINLLADVTISSGYGTTSSPYVVVTS